MYQTISDLYNGRIQPFAHNPDDADYRLAIQDYNRTFEKVAELMGKQHYPLTNAVVQLTAEHERILFSESFRLGMKLAAECFFSDGKQDRNDLV